MGFMFKNCLQFNANLSDWNVANVTICPICLKIVIDLITA